MWLSNLTKEGSRPSSALIGLIDPTTHSTSTHPPLFRLAKNRNFTELRRGDGALQSKHRTTLTGLWAMRLASLTGRLGKWANGNGGPMGGLRAARFIPLSPTSLARAALPLRQPRVHNARYRYYYCSTYGSRSPERTPFFHTDRNLQYAHASSHSGVGRVARMSFATHPTHMYCIPTSAKPAQPKPPLTPGSAPQTPECASGNSNNVGPTREAVCLLGNQSKRRGLRQGARARPQLRSHRY